MATFGPLPRLVGKFIGRVADGAIRDVVDEALGTRGLATRFEADAIETRLASLGDQLDALTDQVRSTHDAEGPEPDALEAAVARLESEHQRLQRRAERARAAIDALEEQRRSLSSAADALKSRTAQVAQLATSAQATAEVAIDGVDSLEGSPTP